MDHHPHSPTDAMPPPPQYNEAVSHAPPPPPGYHAQHHHAQSPVISPTNYNSGPFPAGSGSGSYAQGPPGSYSTGGPSSSPLPPPPPPSYKEFVRTSQPASPIHSVPVSPRGGQNDGTKTPNLDASVEFTRPPLSPTAAGGPPGYGTRYRRDPYSPQGVVYSEGPSSPVRSVTTSPVPLM